MDCLMYVFVEKPKPGAPVTAIIGLINTWNFEILEKQEPGAGG